MKKILTLLLAGIMVLSLASCGTEETPDATTDGGNATSTTAPKTQTPPPPEDPRNPELPDDWTMLESATEWHYKIFTCPFDRDNGAIFPEETDEMKKQLEEWGEEWYKDPDIIAEMKTWDTQTAPMGDRELNLGENGSPIGWANDDNGIICYTTLTLSEEQMEWLSKAQEDSIYMNVFYDNAFYVYINGTLVYSDDANGGEGDWNESQSIVDFDMDVSKLFKAGDNDIVVTLKNCWGGREFLMAIECLYY